MSDQCAVGAAPLDAKPFRVLVDGEKQPMCGLHGRTVQFAQALIDLGVAADQAVFAELAKLLRDGCRGQGCTSLSGPGAEGQSDPPVRGDLQPAALGTPQGEAVS